MGSKRPTDPTHPTHPTGEPDPADNELVVELVDDDAVLPGDGPRIAAADRETIGDDGRRPWHIRRLPRGLRIAGTTLTLTPRRQRHRDDPRALPQRSVLHEDHAAHDSHHHGPEGLLGLISGAVGAAHDVSLSG